MRAAVNVVEAKRRQDEAYRRRETTFHGLACPHHLEAEGLRWTMSGKCKPCLSEVQRRSFEYKKLLKRGYSEDEARRLARQKHPTPGDLKAMKLTG